MEANLFTPEEYKKNFVKNKKGKKEQKVQFLVCDYLKKVYPDVIFMCDLASGMNLGVRLGGMNTRFRSSRGLPDLFIASTSGDPEEALYRSDKPYYAGLFIELKRDGVTIFKKNGDITADEHIREQALILDRLRGLGYMAEFCVGFDSAKKLIDEYLK